MNYCIVICYQIGADPKEVILEKMEITAKKYSIDKTNKETAPEAKTNDYKALKEEYGNSIKKFEEDKL